ncbi:MAG: hypothetical protein JSS49_05470 [Planctomycetes bacterium]|nr:hypothetical protein [Planctomycetota bacterium]
MPCSVYRFGLILALLTITLPGCNPFQSASNDDAELADLDDELTPESTEETTRIKPADRLPEAELELKLAVGDRFPLKKRIEQRLTQSDGVGGSLVNVSLLEMMLSLVVEEVQDGNKRLSVRYHRIRYGHNIAGRKVEYNSDDNTPAPTEALVYAGLKNNGFSFWIGPDNRVVELVGFQEFLQRCLQNVPPAYRDAVLRQLEGTQHEEGLANFVDDGIGLLPYSNDPRHPAVAVKVGSSWELRPRRTEAPIPMSVSTRCQVRNMNDTSAEIGLMGKISGTGTAVTIQDGNRRLQILLRGGYCNGTCTVDRRTGLPTQSEVNRSLEMTVTLPNEMQISQRKEVLTTITSFLDQGMAGDPARASDSQQSRFSHAGFDQASESNGVTQAVGTSSPPRRNRPR